MACCASVYNVKELGVLKKWIAALMMVAFFAFAYKYWTGKKQQGPQWQTAKVERGDVRKVVMATGSINAVQTVLVGSQASGRVLWLGADFNSRVTKGQVVAKLDPALFDAELLKDKAAVQNAQAALEASAVEIKNAQANLSAAKANQKVAKVQVKDALAVVARYKEIANLIPGRDLEAAQAQANTAQARYEQAGSQVLQAEGAVKTAVAKREQAQAGLASAKASLHQSLVNLGHTIIRSPVDGVVISRDVDVGQTVAASLQAPTLFTIANDLKHMQVEASIDEADIGNIKLHQPVTFSVDAFPDEVFKGEVTQIRLKPVEVQNVVTYNVIINVNNPELKLMPGMTANITILIEEEKNVLKVPSLALKFEPPFDGEKKGFGRKNNNSNAGGWQGRMKNPKELSKGKGVSRYAPTVVWVLEGTKIKPVRVKEGLSDGTFTAISNGLKEGMDVVTGMIQTGSSRSNTPGSPFGFGGQQRGGPGGPGGPGGRR